MILGHPWPGCIVDVLLDPICENVAIKTFVQGIFKGSKLTIVRHCCRWENLKMIIHNYFFNLHTHTHTAVLSSVGP